MSSEILKKYFGDLNVDLNLNNQYIKSYIDIDNEKCVFCNKCIEVCPVDAIDLNFPENTVITEKCVHCGTCIDVCPVKAISLTQIKLKIKNNELKIKKSHEKHKLLNYDAKKCIMCNICLKNCPFDAISIEKNQNKMIFTEKCVLCGHCGQICPANAITYE
ncbi:4Fe-4S binding protein [Methanococcus voltae]|nr:4Fe-4S binding protein [Methanococcus voltae]MCS3900918.1 formate hydrogenlyase subunit 6/NADH:ubiquinone oxidoreductase subunit I [Methanococcus voltae]